MSADYEADVTDSINDYGKKYSKQCWAEGQQDIVIDVMIVRTDKKH